MVLRCPWPAVPSTRSHLHPTSQLTSGSARLEDLETGCKLFRISPSLNLGLSFSSSISSIKVGIAHIKLSPLSPFAIFSSPTWKFELLSAAVWLLGF